MNAITDGSSEAKDLPAKQDYEIAKLLYPKERILSQWKEVLICL